MNDEGRSLSIEMNELDLKKDKIEERMKAIVHRQWELIAEMFPEDASPSVVLDDILDLAIDAGLSMPETLCMLCEIRDVVIGYRVKVDRNALKATLAKLAGLR